MNKKHNYQEDDGLQKDDGRIDTFRLVKLSIIARIFLLRCLLIGVALGLIVALMLPWKFVSRFEIRVNGLSTNSPALLAVLNQMDELKDGNPNEVRDLNKKYFFAELSKSINNKEAFYDAYLALTGNKNSEDLDDIFENVVNISALIPSRSQESTFSPGYSVEVTLDSEVKSKKLANNYLENIDKIANNAVMVSLSDINETNRSLNNVRLSVAKEHFRLNSQIKTKSIEDSIGISEIGNIEKPLIQAGSTIASQIPIIDAVPQYFFGFQILRKEKENIEKNAKTDLMIPGYATLMATDYKLVSLSKILSATKIPFFDTVVMANTITKNGWLIRFLVIFIFSFCLFTLGVSWIYFQHLLRARETAKSYISNL